MHLEFVDSTKKVIYLAIRSTSKKWSMPIYNWKAAMNRLRLKGTYPELFTRSENKIKILIPTAIIVKSLTL